MRAEPESTYSAFTRVYYQRRLAVRARRSPSGSQIAHPEHRPDASRLFYIFPLAEQEQTLAVVRGALITAGALLVVLLGTIAWLVTRQVVTPVRLARRIAERLAAGRLEERMHVRGEDDIARLGTSFNQMATSLQMQIRQLEELSRVQRRFVADVSHELRTPLTTVRMAADVLYDHRNDFDAADRAVGGAAAGPARPVRAAAHRPAGDQPVRRWCGGARARPTSTSAIWLAG